MLRPKLLCLGVVALLAACSNLQTEPTDGSTQATNATPTIPTAPAKPATQPVPTTPPIVFDATNSSGTTTVNLPSKDKMSLSEYRAQTRDRLIQSEGARPDVADCAAHASWIIPRSTNFDQFRLPTGALSNDQAKVEPWDSRFSSSKQGAIKVSSVVSFNAAVHKRGTGNDQWEPVRVRCGYDEGMMLAYELLDANGQPFAAPAAAPSSSKARTHCRRGHRCTTSAAAHGKSSVKGKASTKATAKSAKGSSTAKTKSTTASKSTAKSTAKKTTKKSSSN
ncbi:membrane protein [Burkholderiaceae bacterium 26]|nr:membrane protein [Burkholderiaceae bacterium 26]